MNILILTIKLPFPPKDGGAIATLNIAAGLVDSGCQCTILAINTPKHYFSPENIPHELKQKISFITVNVNTRIRWATLVWNLFFSRKPYNAIRFRSLTFIHCLRDLLERQTFDIIQMEGPYLYYCIPVIRQLSRAKTVYRAHNLEYEIWERRIPHVKNPLKRFYLKILTNRIYSLEKSVINLVDMVVPISERDREGFLELGLTKPSIVSPPGLNIPSYPEPSQVTEISLFFIGALDWGPNTEGLGWFFINVWNRLSLIHPGITLHVAGRNSHYYFSRKQEFKGVIVDGEVEDARVFINSHSVMIVPLFSGSGIRIKIIEGMLLGRTVITTSVGAEGLSVTHKKNILIADTADEFIESIEKLISSPNIARTIGSEASRYIKENFDNLVISKKLASFYKEQLL